MQINQISLKILQNTKYTLNIRALVVAQLVEWSFLTPEVCRSNPVITKNYI